MCLGNAEWRGRQESQVAGRRDQGKRDLTLCLCPSQLSSVQLCSALADFSCDTSRLLRVLPLSDR